MKCVFSISVQQHGFGPVRFAWQKKAATYLAAVGQSNVLYFYDRYGSTVSSIPLAAQCTDLEWSPDGQTLAVIQAKSSVVILWDAAQKAVIEVDTKLRHLKFVRWSHNSDLIAIGTGKGSLFLYDKARNEKVPVIGKHSRAITEAAWSWDDVLACVSEDRTFTLSNASGDTVLSMPVSADPSELQWGSIINAEGTQDPVLSIILGQKILLIHNINKPDAPIELGFQPVYGNVVTHRWYGDGYILVGFNTGYLAAITTNAAEFGKEVFSTKNHKGGLAGIAISSVMSKAVSCGDDSLKVLELTDLKDVYAVETIDDDNPADRVDWSDDGQFLTVSTVGGSIYTYLVYMPTLGAAWGTRVAHLLDLMEVSLHDLSSIEMSGKSGKEVTRKLLEFEPSILAVGGFYLAVASNSRAHFFNVASGDQAISKDYAADISALAMNQRYAAALLSDGRLQVHYLDDSNADRLEEELSASKNWLERVETIPRRQCKPPASDMLQRIFPDTPAQRRKSFGVTCVAMSTEYMVFGMDDGKIFHYLLEDWSLIAKHAHQKAVRSIYLQPKGGTRIVYVDNGNAGYVHDPSTNTTSAVPLWPSKARGVLWESQPPLSRSIFITWDDDTITTYVFQPFTIRGPSCTPLGSMKLPFGSKPMLLLNGMLTSLTRTGRLTTTRLNTHGKMTPEQFLARNSSLDDQGKALQLYYMLGMMSEIWALVDVVREKKPWHMLAEAALRALDLCTAKRVYRQALRDAARFLTLEKYDFVEEKNLLAGHVAAILRDVPLAQEFFLKSSQPKEALLLRRHLMHWEQAMALATALAPEEIAIIAREYAQELEQNGRYSDALHMYEKALAASDENQELLTESAREEHEVTCSAGLTRMTLRLGDVGRGLRMLAEATDRKLIYDCGHILYSLKQYAEAAQCYERAEYYDKAAEAWMLATNLPRVGSLLDRITSVHIIKDYAKAKESVGEYVEAVRAYEIARSYDNIVRLFVEHLDNIDGAVSIVRRTRSTESAKLIARYFLARKDYRAVVEFYLLAGMKQEAFELAQQRDVMDHFAELVKDEASVELLQNIAMHLESKGSYLQAGKCLLLAENYPQALRLFLKSPAADDQAIEAAIEAVGEARNDALTHQLIDFLMGETDGIPKDAKYIFKLYMSLGQYREAARTATIIARGEQVLGNYRAARDLLLDNYKQLEATKNHIPAEIDRMLMLLHSYILVKTLVRLDDHYKAARMLIRVSNNISKFPSHTIQILTSTVIECYRAGLKHAAFDYAAMLMRPEHRNKIDPKYRKRIEQIVRRPEKDAIEEAATPCPYCGNMVPETVLDCVECKNHIPYCIATGCHMVLTDWTQCPSCNFPALYSQLQELLTKSPACPMCSEKVDPVQITLLTEPDARQILSGRSQGDDPGDKERVEKVSDTPRTPGSAQSVVSTDRKERSAPYNHGDLQASSMHSTESGIAGGLVA
ncbi:WD repeat-containing protein 19 [Gaertneriomyces semiglobifer]|nr:WD repeat-containing protein 19 [Gaertneriomyces semiglobifer]